MIIYSGCKSTKKISFTLCFKSLYWIKSEYRFPYHFGLKIHQHIDRVIENLVYNLNIAIRENYGTRNSVLLIVHHIRECIMTFIILARLDFYRQDLTSIFYHKVQLTLLLVIEIIKI